MGETASLMYSVFSGQRADSAITPLTATREEPPPQISPARRRASNAATVVSNVACVEWLARSSSLRSFCSRYRSTRAYARCRYLQILRRR